MGNGVEKSKLLLYSLSSLFFGLSTVTEAQISKVFRHDKGGQNNEFGLDKNINKKNFLYGEIKDTKEYEDTITYSNGETIDIADIDGKFVLVNVDNENPYLTFRIPSNAESITRTTPGDAVNSFECSTKESGTGLYIVGFTINGVSYSYSIIFDYKPDIPHNIDVSSGDVTINIPFSNLWSNFSRYHYENGNWVEKSTNDFYLFTSSDIGIWRLYSKENSTSSTNVMQTFIVGGNTTNNNEQKNDDIKVYPNPTSGPITIEGLKNISGVELQIYSSNGKLVKTIQDFKGFVDISNLPSGVYNVYMLLPEEGKNKGRVVKKTIIKK